MKRMQPILDMVRSSVLTAFPDADLGVQTSVLYAMVNSSLGTAKSYNEMLDNPENDTASNEIRKGWEQEVHRAETVSKYIMAQLHRLSHAVVADDAEVVFDSVYDDGTEVTGDDTVEEVAIKTHPYAWAKSKLIQRGLWPMTMTDEGPKDLNDWSKYENLTLWKYDAVIKKMAARAIGAWIVQIRDTGDIVPSKRSGADAVIISMCPDVCKLAKIEDDDLLEKRIVMFTKNNCGGIVYTGDEKYSAHELLEAFEDIQDADEIDNLKREVRQTGREIRRSIHGKLVQSTAFDTIKKTLESIKDEDAKRTMIESFTDQLNASQYKELLSCLTANTPQTSSSSS